LQKRRRAHKKINRHQITTVWYRYPILSVDRLPTPLIFRYPLPLKVVWYLPDRIGSYRTRLSFPVILLRSCFRKLNCSTHQNPVAMAKKKKDNEFKTDRPSKIAIPPVKKLAYKEVIYRNTRRRLAHKFITKPRSGTLG
jgi:hypothetical protein